MGSASSSETRKHYEQMSESSHKVMEDKKTHLSKEKYKDHKFHKGDKIGGNLQYVTNFKNDANSSITIKLVNLSEANLSSL